MKIGKLALLATLTAALAFGGLPAANAVATAPAIPPEVQNPLVPSATGEATPEGTELPDEEASEAPAPETLDPAPVPAPSEAVAPVPEPHPATESETAGAEDDGYVYVPVGEGHVVPGPDTPLVTEEDGSIRSVVESEHEHVEPMLARGGAASMLAAPSRAGNIKVTLVRATVRGNGNLISLPSARNSITSANNYWRSMSNGRLSMSIASERVHYSSTANANDDYAVMMNKIAKELKWVDNPYTALVVFVPTADLKSGGYGGILGGGWTVGGTAGRILMPAPSSFTNNVVTHEVGHVLGLLHANSLQCTNGHQDVGSGNGGRWTDGACSSREYGDTTDLMGSAQYNQPVINSYFWDAGSFGRGNEIADAGRAGTPRTYTLRPWGGTAANRAVKFTDPQSGDTYYIELRQPAGYDQYLQSGPSGNRGVKIVKADKANSWAVNSLIIPPSTRPFAGYYNGNHAWQAGQTFTTHTGTTVKINSVSASSASITVAAKSAEWHLRNSGASAIPFGSRSEEVLSCDWNGDGVASPASFRAGKWTVRSNNSSSAGTSVFYFGDTGDQPICGDWDGDGKDTPGVYRQGKVFLRNSNSSGPVDGTFYFGQRGDIAITGDWDGDGCDTLGVTRPEGRSNRFYLTNSNIRPATHGTFIYGNAGDVPVAGDWNGDGFSSVGVHRGNRWYLSDSNLRPVAHHEFAYGNPGDRPVTGIWKRGQGTGVGIVR
ncbi:zinc-dependent metalloprotease family protein [Arthrobacter sp. Edens01]|uniref:zinc-dependent metalloprotease family protein n=1 Tax=Arthrobacter sp. Edens01 TaxID=1732020 RepID=UPI0006DA9E04|nr:zinc-dependent metalloprotease family protein [Arthrobacter sp. Edens01]KPN18389.1 hypothetical protein AO716_11190 [Arthrobacter sp. Edens01]